MATAMGQVTARWQCWAWTVTTQKDNPWKFLNHAIFYGTKIVLNPVKTTENEKEWGVSHYDAVFNLSEFQFWVEFLIGICRFTLEDRFSFNWDLWGECPLPIVQVGGA